jgi:malate dehydrogenase
MASLAVMGVGRIGGEAAYLAAVRGIADELVLSDSAAGLLEAQVLDLTHTGLDLSISTRVKDMKEADVCIFAAGLPRDPSVKTRADLLNANISAAREFVDLMTGFSGILITITNPMDAMNFYMSDKTGIGRERCIGFGGQLDSARLGIALRARGYKTKNPASVLGEHGEHQVPVFSNLPEKIPVGTREEILLGLRGSSMEVIKGKGGTVFGPAYHICELVRMVLSDSRSETICSSVLEGEYGISGCSLGVPVEIGREGIRRITEWKLDAWEQEKMEEAGTFVGELCKKAVT